MRVSDNKVGVTNGGACNVKYFTKLPFPHLYNKAAESDTLEEFLTSLMSFGKISNDGNLSIFTKEGVTVYKEDNALLTHQRKPILIVKQY